MARRRHRARNGESSEDDEESINNVGPSEPSLSARAIARAQRRHAQRNQERDEGAEDNAEESSEDEAPRLRLTNQNPQARPTREESLLKIRINARAIVSELYDIYIHEEGRDKMKETLNERLRTDGHSTNLTDIQRELDDKWTGDDHPRHRDFYLLMQQIIYELTPPPPPPRAPPTPTSSPRGYLAPKLRV